MDGITVKLEAATISGGELPFSGHVVLVGIDPATGDIADLPVMDIDEFRRLVMFSISSDSRHSALLRMGH